MQHLDKIMYGFTEPSPSTPISAANMLTVVECASQAREWAVASSSQASRNAGSLIGLCAHAAAELQERLVAKGFKPVIHVLEDRRDGLHHCYVALGSLVVDVTATQFEESEQPIVVIDRKLIDVVRTPWWAIGTTVEDRSELIDFLDERGWPKEQIPSGMERAWN